MKYLNETMLEGIVFDRRLFGRFSLKIAMHFIYELAPSNSPWPPLLPSQLSNPYIQCTLFLQIILIGFDLSFKVITTNQPPTTTHPPTGPLTFTRLYLCLIKPDPCQNRQHRPCSDQFGLSDPLTHLTNLIHQTYLTHLTHIIPLAYVTFLTIST